jgi:hypothetical protein
MLYSYMFVFTYLSFPPFRNPSWLKLSNYISNMRSLYLKYKVKNLIR